MNDFRCLLADLRRPRLLIRAARFGLTEYRRERDLRRLIDGAAPPEVAVSRLLCEERKMEEDRCRGDAGYSVARHIELLIALLAEAQSVSRA
jgi:hypothetical protein